jgi:hypothetical protein
VYEYTEEEYSVLLSKKRMTRPLTRVERFSEIGAVPGDAIMPFLLAGVPLCGIAKICEAFEALRQRHSEHDRVIKF